MYRRPNGWKEVSKNEINTWVERYRTSSLGLRRFAEENGLSVQRLRYWVYDKRNAKDPEPQGETGLQTEARPVEAAPVFQEIKLAATLPQQSWALEVSLPNGIAIRFQNLPEPAWLGSLVKAWRRPC